MLLVIAALSLVWVGVEVAVRLSRPMPSFASETVGAFSDEYHPRYGWRGIPNISRNFTLTEFKTRVETNEHGFREDSWGRLTVDPDARTVPRVVFLGDSFAWGWGVERSQRVSEHVEQLCDVDAVNLAFSGHGPDQQLLVLRDYGRALAPDVVVLLLFRNDFSDIASNHRYHHAKPMFDYRSGQLVLTNVPVPYDSTFWEAKTTLAQLYGVEFEGFDRVLRGIEPRRVGVLQRTLERSHAHNWVKFRLSQLRTPGVSTCGEDSSEPDSTSVRLKRKMVLMALILDELRKEVREQGAEFLIALVPEKEQVLEWKRDDTWQRYVSNYCEHRRIPYVDLLPHFRGDASTYWRIDPHWTPRAHRKAAEQICPALVDLCSPRRTAKSKI